MTWGQTSGKSKDFRYLAIEHEDVKCKITTVCVCVYITADITGPLGLISAVPMKGWR